MDRIWQWTWDRYSAKYSWVAFMIAVAVSLPTYIFGSCLIVAVEQSKAYIEAAAITVVAVPLLAYANILPGLGWGRLIDRWAGGRETDAAKALNASYAWARGMVTRILGCNGICVAILWVIVSAIARCDRSAVSPIRDSGRRGRSGHRAERIAQPRRSGCPSRQGGYRRRHAISETRCPAPGHPSPRGPSSSFSGPHSFSQSRRRCWRPRSPTLAQNLSSSSRSGVC